ncbi:MAG TPA: hypothetical protein VIR33_14015, partial [Thermopolyspora sp.]
MLEDRVRGSAAPHEPGPQPFAPQRFVTYVPWTTPPSPASPRGLIRLVVPVIAVVLVTLLTADLLVLRALSAR